MKNPYKKGKVHPSPHPDNFLSLLPTAILSIAAALSPDDRHVLAYLVSCPNSSSSAAAPPRRYKPAGGGGGDDRGGDHVPSFGCDCFRCYMSYWVRWDTSPNRQLIHEIIEAYEEDQLVKTEKKKKGTKKKRGKRSVAGGFVKDSSSSISSSSSKEEGSGEVVVGPVGCSGEEEEKEEGVDQPVGEVDNKGTVRKVVGFLGEKIWGFWGRD